MVLKSSHAFKMVIIFNIICQNPLQVKKVMAKDPPVSKRPPVDRFRAI